MEGSTTPTTAITAMPAKRKTRCERDIPSRAGFVLPARLAEGFGGNGCFKVAHYTAEHPARNRRRAVSPKCHKSFQRVEGGSVSAGDVAEGCGKQLDLAAAGTPLDLIEEALQWLEQRRSGSGNATADDDGFRIEDVG